MGFIISIIYPHFKIGMLQFVWDIVYAFRYSI